MDISPGYVHLGMCGVCAGYVRRYVQFVFRGYVRGYVRGMCGGMGGGVCVDPKSENSSTCHSELLHVGREDIQKEEKH